MLHRYLIPALVIIHLSGFLSACSQVPVTTDGLPPPPTEAETDQARQTVTDVFERFYQTELDHSPVLRSQLGLSGQFDWDDISPEAYENQVARWQSLRNDLSSVREDALSDSDKASYQALLHTLEYRLLQVPFSQYVIRLNDQNGWHKEVARTLVLHHPISSIPEAHDYISRLEEIPQLFKRWEENIRSASDEGFVAPDFVYDDVRATIEAILDGEPFTSGSKLSPLWSDFKQKLDALHLYPSTARLLERKARNALQDDVAPAYRSLLILLDEQHKLSENRVALGEQPEGLRYYQLLLGHYSGGQMDANDIHQIGLAEVSRVQQLLKRHAAKSGLTVPSENPNNAVFDWINSQQKHYTDNDAGRDEFIGYQKKLIADMAARIPYFFVDIPATPLGIKVVPDNQAWLDPAIHYEAQSLDGSRPGLLVLNPEKMNDISQQRQASLAYRNALPGLHMSTAVARENESLPDFRRISAAPAFSQGWALYADKLAVEMGMYNSTEELLGQLLNELRDSAALVVDTGIHAKNWSREQALAWMTSETPLSIAESEALLEECILNPGKSVSAKMGQFRISALRQEMEDRLGARFDLAAFHSALLTGGPLPMETLETSMRQWARDIKSNQ